MINSALEAAEGTAGSVQFSSVEFRFRFWLLRLLLLLLPLLAAMSLVGGGLPFAVSFGSSGGATRIGKADCERSWRTGPSQLGRARAAPARAAPANAAYSGAPRAKHDNTE